jgi:molybdopterin-guanine dinucleotide biosynthesis protein A
VIAGLEACTAERAWVLACDLPALSGDVLEALAAAFRPGDDVVLPESAGRLQPLCALYAVQAAVPLRAAAIAGRRSLLDACASLQVRVLGEAARRRADPHDASFQNINTPADLARLEATR